MVLNYRPLGHVNIPLLLFLIYIDDIAGSFTSFLTFNNSERNASILLYLKALSMTKILKFKSVVRKTQCLLRQTKTLLVARYIAQRPHLWLTKGPLVHMGNAKVFIEGA